MEKRKYKSSRVRVVEVHLHMSLIEVWEKIEKGKSEMNSLTVKLGTDKLSSTHALLDAREKMVAFMTMCNLS